MERIGFYLSARRPVERVIGAVAAKALAEGQRMVIVAEDPGLLERLDRALWDYRPEAFLAHGRSGDPYASRQPLLLANDCAATNGAKVVALADGKWRPEAETFERALLFFDDAHREDAREVWRTFDGRDDVDREFIDLDGNAGEPA